MLNDYVKYLPRKTMIQLFSEVFEQLPAVMADVAPDGWEESPYYPLFHFSPEESMLRALLDRTILVQYEQRFGVLKHGQSGATDVESLFKQFRYEHRPEPVHPELELCGLFSEALRKMTIGSKFVLGESAYLYEVNPPVADMAAVIAARDAGILTEKPFQLPYVRWEKRTLVMEANFIPLMRHLFRALKATDFHWEYVDGEALDFIDYCKRFEAGQAADAPPYYASEQDHRLGITGSPKLDDCFSRVEKELPDDAVVAYTDVFGEWPKGFPVDKDYYLAWYDRLSADKGRYNH